MGRNYLLDHIRRDGLATVVFCLLFGGLGLVSQWALAGDGNAALRFAGLSAAGISLLGLAIAGPAAFNPSAHHSLKALTGYGPLAEVLAELQDDGVTAARYGRLRLGRNWLTACGVGFTVVRRDEIAGVDLAATEVCSGGVRVGSNWRLVVTTRDGRVVDFNCPNQETARLLKSQLL
jgi:hypothetical protein